MSKPACAEATAREGCKPACAEATAHEGCKPAYAEATAGEGCKPACAEATAGEGCKEAKGLFHNTNKRVYTIAIEQKMTVVEGLARIDFAEAEKIRRGAKPATSKTYGG